MSTRGRARRCFRPALEALERRDCPAFNIYYTNSLLLIRGHPTLPFVNPGDGLQLNVVAGLVQVQEVGGTTTINYGSYRPPTTIEVALDYNTDHDLTVNLGGVRVPSNLLLSLGKGNTDVFGTIVPFHPINIVNGTLGGNLTILGGSGGEFIDLGGLGGVMPVVIQGDTNATLSPTHTPTGGDTLDVNDNSQLLGNLTGTELDNINIGLGIAPVIVRKNVSLSVPRSGNAGKLDIFGFGEVDGNVSFQGSPAINSVFSDSVIVEAGGTVLGNVTAALGNGSGIFRVSGTVDGSVSLTGALGNDTVTLAGSVLGSVQMNLRSGDDLVAFTGSVGGSLSIVGGNGNDDLTLFTGTVGGDLSFNFGNGNDTLTITNAPGGRLTWTSGNGNDSVTFGDATAGQTWNVNMRFGTGADTLTLTGTNPEFITGFVDMGGPPGGNTFSQGANWTIVQPWTLQNV